MIRDRTVEANILKILRERLSDCVLYNYPTTRPSESDSPCYEVEVRQQQIGTRNGVEVGATCLNLI